MSGMVESVKGRNAEGANGGGGYANKGHPFASQRRLLNGDGIQIGSGSTGSK